MVLNYLKIYWQIKYSLSRFYLEILRWSFVWIGDWYKNSSVEKLIILTAFFLEKHNLLNSVMILSPDKTAVW